MTDEKSMAVADRWKTLNCFVDRIVKNKELRPADIAVWLVIFRYGDKNGESIVSKEKIREFTGIKSKNTVDGVLRHLKQLNLISVKKRGNDATDSNHRCNVWYYQFVRK